MSSFVTDRRVEQWLRWSFAVVYIWFGALKPLGLSPAHELVELTLAWFPRPLIVGALGLWEVAIGVCFLFPRITRLTMWMFVIHMIGTFLPMVALTEVAWTRPPYALSLVGQYIVKNLVFLAAGAALWRLHVKD